MGAGRQLWIGVYPHGQLPDEISTIACIPTAEPVFVKLDQGGIADR